LKHRGTFFVVCVHRLTEFFFKGDLDAVAGAVSASKPKPKPKPKLEQDDQTNKTHFVWVQNQTPPEEGWRV